MGDCLCVESSCTPPQPADSHNSPFKQTYSIYKLKFCKAKLCLLYGLFIKGTKLGRIWTEYLVFFFWHELQKGFTQVDFVGRSWTMKYWLCLYKCLNWTSPYYKNRNGNYRWLLLLQVVKMKRFSKAFCSAKEIIQGKTSKKKQNPISSGIY